jgi:hypothetical protein
MYVHIVQLSKLNFDSQKIWNSNLLLDNHKKIELYKYYNKNPGIKVKKETRAPLLYNIATLIKNVGLIFYIGKKRVVIHASIYGFPIDE